jgi:uroporphyrin-III C-methyltransferase
MKTFPPPKVILAGAGPGDPELITRKAFRYLETADVIIVDRLVDESLLDYSKAHAEVFFVGKEGGNTRSTSQTEIDQLLIEKAKEGKLVLRLKGGDVSFFSNIMSELEALVAHDIPYEVIPGVTAASGAAASAGIPLTARGFASSVRFLSYTKPESIHDSEFKELAETKDTLVFYMSSSSLPQMVKRLLLHNVDPDVWVAVVEQATTPFQKVVAHPIAHFLTANQERKFKSPSLIIIGKVAKLYHDFKWMPETKEESDFFKSVSNEFLKVQKVA